MKAEEFKRWNEEMVRRFPSVDYYERSNFIVRWIERRRLKFLVREVAAAAPERLLEIGCGACHVLERLPARMRIGTDISPTMLSVSARRTAGTDIRLIRSEAEHLPFADGAFDCVICTEVLEHVLDPGAVIAEAARVLAPGGLAIFTVPHEALIDFAKRAIVLVKIDRLFANVAEARAKGWHLHDFTLGSFRKLLAAHFPAARVKRLPLAVLPLRYAACVTKPTKGNA